jgi:hypothetical protein
VIIYVGYQCSLTPALSGEREESALLRIYFLRAFVQHILEADAGVESVDIGSFEIFVDEVVLDQYRSIQVFVD